MMKLLILFSSLVFLHFVSSTALACSCAAIIAGTTEKQLIETGYQKAQGVFSGKVLKTKEIKSSQDLQVTFKVLEIWKGLLGEKITITTDNSPAGCTYPFEVGKSYLVYAYSWESDTLRTNFCTQTKKLFEAENRDLKVLGKGTAPKKSKT